MFALVIVGGFLTFVGTLSLVARTVGQFVLAVAILATGVSALGLATRLNRSGRE